MIGKAIIQNIHGELKNVQARCQRQWFTGGSSNRRDPVPFFNTQLSGIKEDRIRRGEMAGTS